MENNAFELLMGRMDMLHIYCIIRTSQEHSCVFTGIQGAEVSVIPYLDIGAVVSSIPIIDYKVLRKEELYSYLFSHQGLIERIMDDYAVIPVKFGTIATDGEEVRQFLKKGYPCLNDTLIKMNSKIEVDVVALWNDLKLILYEIGEEEEIRRFKDSIALRPPEETLQERIAMGKMVKSALDKKRVCLSSEILKSLRELACDYRCHNSLDDSMIMNVAFLIDRDKQKEFDEKIIQLDARYENKINFRCVGPLPPYSFSMVEFQKKDLEEVNRSKALLGVTQTASPSEIKQAYRKLSYQYHPDTNPVNQDLDGKFKELTEAYKTLIKYCQSGVCYSENPGDKDFTVINIYN